jgi:tRNA-Thr(GGU) m(6)t(6)A37 methyltransferase TsaA
MEDPVGEEKKPHSICFEPIGIIRTNFTSAAGTPVQTSRANGARGTVHIFESFRPGLKDLKGFERVWLIYWFDRSRPPELLVTPYLDTVKRGVFATRAPSRPSAIGISPVRLLSVHDGVLEVADVDILDGTPLLDVKPYVPEFDAHPVSRAGWFDKTRDHSGVADDRFEENR